MNKRYYEKIDETIYTETLENGLVINLIPKKDFNKVYATFTTKYGSINNNFICNEKTYNQPKGIAHYLEHKMFDMPDGEDVFNKLSRLGAQSNAFTSYNQTCYLFSATSNIYECMEILLDFVQTPYFTDETVEKERGIIEQEIKMYDDYPDVILDRGLTELLFLETPYKDDIAGKVEDIKQITAKDLYDAYNAFYNPNNMIVTVVGNFDEEEMLDFIKNNQAKKSFENVRVESLIKEEPMEIRKNFNEKTINLAIPKIAFGIKLNKRTDILKSEMELLLYTELLLGDTSKNYDDLIKDKLINESFSISYSVNDQIRYIVVNGDTDKPYELRDRLIQIFKENKEFDKDKFELCKKALLGEYISIFNSLEYTSRLFTKYLINNESIFDIIEVIDNITLEDIYNISKEINLDLACCFILK